MRLENINEGKTIVSYRVECQTKFNNYWTFIKQYKTLEQAQKRADEFKCLTPNTTKVRIVKYTQIIEIISTEYGEVKDGNGN